ncbi:hypothetical protein ACA910_003643 [Epithemia clementina (nom. ined.)]
MENLAQVYELDEKPKRPLSAYNLYFQSARKTLLANRPVRPQGVPRRGHGKMGFAEMARTIADQWNVLDQHSKKEFEDQAKVEKLRYKKKVAEWKARTDPLITTRAAPSNNKTTKLQKNTTATLSQRAQFSPSLSSSFPRLASTGDRTTNSVFSFPRTTMTAPANATVVTTESTPICYRPSNNNTAVKSDLYQSCVYTTYQQQYEETSSLDSGSDEFSTLFSDDEDDGEEEEYDQRQQQNAFRLRHCDYQQSNKGQQQQPPFSQNNNKYQRQGDDGYVATITTGVPSSCARTNDIARLAERMGNESVALFLDIFQPR